MFRGEIRCPCPQGELKAIYTCPSILGRETFTALLDIGVHRPTLYSGKKTPKFTDSIWTEFTVGTEGKMTL